MNFLPTLLHCITLIPGIVQATEELLGGKTGADKKAAALSVIQNAASVDANRNIADPQKFQEGLGKVVDGVVECLNASVWAAQH